MDWNKAHQGNILELAKILPPNSIHCIVTSPPYWGLRDYSTDPVDWPGSFYTPMAGLPYHRVEAWRGHLGLEPTIEMYVSHLAAIFRALWPALREDGTLWVNLGDSYVSEAKGSTQGVRSSTLKGAKTYETETSPARFFDKSKTGLAKKNLCGIPWRVAFALQAEGWILRSDCIWHKPNSMPESVMDRPTRAHEYLFLLAKSERYFYDGEAIKEPVKASSIARAGGDVSDQHKNLNGVPGQPPYTMMQPRSNWRYGGNKADGYGSHTYGGNDCNLPEKANKRDVWTVATGGYSGTHFATFPIALIEPCILAGCPPLVCAQCGAPWERITKKTGKSLPVEERHGRVGHNGQPPQQSGWFWNGPTTTATDTWQAGCNCETDTQPGVVLDPFLGSGTTAVAAVRNRRNWLGFELNADYISQVYRRLDGQQIKLI